MESDNTGEADVGNTDVEGWCLVQLKGKLREIRVITEHTPNLHLYKQTHVIIDGNDISVQWRKLRKTPIIAIKKLIFTDGCMDSITSESDGGAQIKNSTEESEERREEKKM